MGRQAGTMGMASLYSLSVSDSMRLGILAGIGVDMDRLTLSSESTIRALAGDNYTGLSHS